MMFRCIIVYGRCRRPILIQCCPADLLSRDQAPEMSGTAPPSPKVPIPPNNEIAASSTGGASPRASPSQQIVITSPQAPEAAAKKAQVGDASVVHVSRTSEPPPPLDAELHDWLINNPQVASAKPVAGISQCFICPC